MASWRWPLKATRGFSATPRRSRGASTSARTARRIVKKAGPLESAYFTNSTLLDPTIGDTPTSYTQSAVRESNVAQFNLFTEADYSQEGGARERIKIKRFQVDIRLRALMGATLYNVNEYIGLALVLGTPDDITDDVDTQNVNPWGSQASLILYSELPRGIRFAKRTHRLMIHPPIGVGATGTDPDARNHNIVHSNGRSEAVVSLSFKNRWIREPEKVVLLTWSMKSSSAGEAIGGFAGIAGYHTVRCIYARY